MWGHNLVKIGEESLAYHGFNCATGILGSILHPKRERKEKKKIGI